VWIKWLIVRSRGRTIWIGYAAHAVANSTGILILMAALLRR
jgi:hypothetical protein